MTTSRDITNYLRGMRFLQTRSLRSEERFDLKRRRVAAFVRGVLCTLAIPAVIAAASQAPLLLTDGFWPRVLFGLSLYGLPLLTLTAIRCLALAVQLGRDQLRGDVEVFAEEDADGVTHQSERLPFSGVVWTINDKPTAITSVEPSVPVANAPEAAEVAAQWLEPCMESTEKKYFANRRQMTRTESLELRRHQLQLAWTRWRGLYAFDLFVAFVLAVSTAGTRIGVYDKLGGIALIAVLLAFHHRPLRDLWTAFTLSGDIAQGRLLIVKVERDQATSPIYEVLPKSGMPWSVDGLPAPWRLGLPYTAW